MFIYYIGEKLNNNRGERESCCNVVRESPAMWAK